MNRKKLGVTLEDVTAALYYFGRDLVLENPLKAGNVEIAYLALRQAIGCTSRQSELGKREL